jgi:hypothetical protein
MEERKFRLSPQAAWLLLVCPLVLCLRGGQEPLVRSNVRVESVDY